MSESSIQPPVKVWSAGREWLFHFCPCAFFYNYHLANAGFDPNAATEQKLLYRLKHLLPLHVWKRNLFRRTLRETFYHATAEFTVKAFQQRLIRNLLKDESALLREDWRRYPESVNLYEVYYGHLPRDEAFAFTRNSLDMNAERLATSGLFEQLQKIARLDRIEVPDFFHFNLNALLVWCALDLGWRQQDTVHLLAVSEDTGGERCLTNAALHKIYAQYNLMTPPDKTISREWGMAAGTLFVVPDHKINISQTLNRLNETAQPLCPATRPDSTQQHEFRRHHDNCGKCRFLEYCETRGHVRK